MQSLKEKLNELATELGFCKFGVAKVENLEKEINYYQDWLNNNYHSSMSWLERNQDKRQNIDKILHGAKSVIVLAYNYYTDFDYPYEETLKSENLGKISRYAWGNDYHDIILNKLNDISLFLQTLDKNSQSKSYVDTGPILERQWAVKSGIGWQGKNGMLITKECGSYVFLGIIITTCEIESDTKLEDYCGNCTKCIDACPTNAIIKPKVIDSNKCISYWTIEAKPEKEIPTNIANKLNNWVFGCDICQEVCPWNKFKKINNDEFFKPRNKTYLSKKEINNMKDEDFRVKFKNSPIKRTKLKGLKRNFSALNQNNLGKKS